MRQERLMLGWLPIQRRIYVLHACTRALTAALQYVQPVEPRWRIVPRDICCSSGCAPEPIRDRPEVGFSQRSHSGNPIKSFEPGFCFAQGCDNSGLCDHLNAYGTSPSDVPRPCWMTFEPHLRFRSPVGDVNRVLMVAVMILFGRTCLP